MSRFKLPSGRKVASLGQGTWRMGEQRARRAEEIAALRTGLDLGLALIDTAEMYGDGGAEELIGEALAGRRDEAYVVSKVLPGNATRRGTIAACERSLRRLKTDYLDLYLLHWRQSEPLAETLEAFAALKKAGSIRAYGVSNFDRADLEESATLPGGTKIATNQVLYGLEHRGIEWELLPWCRERGVSIMAYSPLGSGASAVRALLGERALRTIAERRAAAPAQIALAWVLRQPDVYAIPKAGRVEHVRENAAALEIELDADELRELDAAFPPPRRATSLEML
ncbi:MAG TPA: aldo/keto reductase [Gammaproteobacteria bacterium]|nr:aldo/keto reductase [Gammaproteobacteria bacterium]